MTSTEERQSAAQILESFREMLQSTTKKESRPEEFVRSLRQVGIEAVKRGDTKAGSEELYSLSVEKSACPPPPQWRRMANTIMRLDEENLPVAVAYGPSELFPPKTDSLDWILDSAVIGNYSIQPILFGTTCWLYYYGGRWRLATKRSVDASGLVLRRGDPTLGERFAACVGNISELYSRLRTNSTYGFVLHDQRMHIYHYAGFESKIWNISCVHTDTGIEGRHWIGISFPPILFQSGLLFRHSAPPLPSTSECIGAIIRRREWSEPREPTMTTIGTQSDEAVPNLPARMIHMRFGPTSLDSNPTIATLRNEVVGLCEACSLSLHHPDKCNFGFILRTTGSCRTFPDDHIIIKSPLYLFVEKYVGRILPRRRIVGEMLYSSDEEKETFFRFFHHLLPLFQQAERRVEAMATMAVKYQTDCPSLTSPTKLVPFNAPSASFVQRLYAAIESTCKKLPFDLAFAKKALLDPACIARQLIIEGIVALLPTEEDMARETDFPPLK